tara:strand:+ start:50 stop:238 length:189 start_codon:yes stop_codon:yes gene_type:complete
MSLLVQTVILKKTETTQWANAEVGVACQMISQTITKVYDADELIDCVVESPKVIYELADGWC